MTQQNFFASDNFETSSSVILFNNRRADIKRRFGALGQVVQLPQRSDASLASSSTSSSSSPPRPDGQLGEAPMCLIFDSTHAPPTRGHPHSPRFVSTQSISVANKGDDDDDESAFTSVSQRLRLRDEQPSSSVADGGDNLDVAEEVKSLDPTLQKLYRSQLRNPAANRTIVTSSKAHDANRLAALHRVDALIEQRVKDSARASRTSSPKRGGYPRTATPTQPTPLLTDLPNLAKGAGARSEQFGVNPLRDDATHRSVAGAADTAYLPFKVPRAVDALHLSGTRTHDVSSTLSLRERWKMTSAHYRRVTETFSPTRHSRSARSSTSSPLQRTQAPRTISPQWDSSKPPSIHAAVFDAAAGNIYDGYISPIAVLLAEADCSDF